MEGLSIDNKVLYLYVGDMVGENPDNLPASVLAKTTRESGPILRLAYVKESNRVYVQDASFRRLMSRGDESAWGRLNSGLMFLSEKHGARFPERAYGDPPGSTIKRKMSQYQKAWGHVSRYMRDEFGIQPADLEVCEYSPLPGQEKDRVSFSAKGANCGGDASKAPVLLVNRHMSTGKDGDSDFAALGDAVGAFYLENLEQIMGDASPDTGFANRLSRHKNNLSGDMMFAMVGDDGKTKVHKVPYWDRDRYHDEDSLRRSESLSGYSGPIVVFHVLGTEIRLQNAMPSRMKGHAATLLKDVVGVVAHATGASNDAFSLTFDPSLSRPFVSKASRHSPLWDAIREHFEKHVDIAIVEAPVPLKKGVAALVEDHAMEDEVSPGGKKFRALRGVKVEYPYILVDNRVASTGTKYRAILEEYSRMTGLRPEPRHDVSDMAPRMTNFFRLGMNPGEVVDMMADRGDFVARAKAWSVARDAWKAFAMEFDPKTARSRGVTKVAHMGLGIGINDWWYIGSQEALNQSAHQNDQPSTKPFNLKERKSRKPKPEDGKPKSYEEMLGSKHDAEMPAQKTTEQLLEESRI